MIHFVSKTPDKDQWVIAITSWPFILQTGKASLPVFLYRIIVYFICVIVTLSIKVGVISSAWARRPDTGRNIIYNSNTCPSGNRLDERLCITLQTQMFVFS